jgi:O-succinylbenzoate synthase
MLFDSPLHIARITTHPIAMPLVHRFETSFGGGQLWSSVIVRLETKSGAVGWGEVTAMFSPGYSYETGQTALHILNDFLIPRLLQQSVCDFKDWAWLEGVRGHPIAKHGLLSAILSAWAEEQGLPLAEVIQRMAGASTRQERIKVGVSVGIEKSIDATLAVVAGHIAEGYGRIKLKIKPGWDVEVMRQVRRAFSDVLLMADANSAYRLDDAPLLRQLDDLDLLMIEQPLGYDDIWEHSRLRPQLKTPLCLDESLHSFGHVQLAHQLQACDIVNLKPQRVGGIWEAIEIHNFCQQNGLQLWVGGMLETGIGRAMSVTLASLPHVTLPSDLSATKRYYDPDLAEPYFELNPDSTLTVPSAPGLGVTVDEARLAEAEARYKNR